MLPFRGQSSIETMHAILHSQPPPLHARPALSAAAADDLQRIIDKCLAKDPDDRYQGMKDLVVDLKAARRRLDTVVDAGDDAACRDGGAETSARIVLIGRGLRSRSWPPLGLWL